MAFVASLYVPTVLATSSYVVAARSSIYFPREEDLEALRVVSSCSRKILSAADSRLCLGCLSAIYFMLLFKIITKKLTFSLL